MEILLFLGVQILKQIRVPCLHTQLFSFLVHFWDIKHIFIQHNPKSNIHMEPQVATNKEHSENSFYDLFSSHFN